MILTTNGRCFRRGIKGDSRAESADRTRPAKRGVYECRLEWETRDTFTAEIVCTACLRADQKIGKSVRLKSKDMLLVREK